MTAMEKTHGFRARCANHRLLIIGLISFANRYNSKSQYIRRFEQWGFKKNFTDEEWKFIARQSQKRTLEGKDSDVYRDNRLVPRKKVKKEILRHTPPSWQVMAIADMHPADLL